MAAWKQEHILTTYDLAKSGYVQEEIAKAIGVTVGTFINWKKKYPILRKALRKGCAYRKGEQHNGFSFRDYVYERLSSECKETWDKINEIEKKKNGYAMIQSLLDQRGVTIRQHLFLYAWTSSNFSLSRACKKVCINRQTFINWCETDSDFAELVEEIDWHKKNFFEEHLCKLVAGGDTAATIMVNKTYNADRGYGEKTKIEVETKETHEHIVRLDVLGLSIEEKRMLLQKARTKKIESTVVESEDD
jgi:hypothetical protein